MTSIGLLYLIYILAGKTAHNPLSEEITSYDINQFFNTSSSELSLTSFLDMQEIKEKKNLRNQWTIKNVKIIKTK